jgi:hypothetical protein
MAVQHIDMNTTASYGQRLRSQLTAIEDQLGQLVELRNTMQLMIDGDGSSSTHFTYMTAKFGYADNTFAKASWDELNSALAKLTTNNSVDNVAAALAQLFNKHR